MASPEPTESASGPVPSAVQGSNRLAVASFLLSFAVVGTGLYAESLLYATLNVLPPYGPFNPAPDYTVPSLLYWGSVAASVVAIVLGRIALSEFKQHPHEKARVGFAQGAVLIGTLALVVLVCGGAWYSVANSLKGLH